jgi:predicted RNA-binding protein with PUA-like domain
MATRYWLFKTEPSAYSFDDLVRDGRAEWDGVRNFQVRNWLRDDIKAGDGVLFYHSSTSPVGVVGTARVVRDGYPDHTAWDPNSAHPDPKSTPEKPLWYMVDIAPDLKLDRFVTVDEMRATPELSEMMTLKRGNRFSITPVTQEEFETVVRLGMQHRD